MKTTLVLIHFEKMNFFIIPMSVCNALHKRLTGNIAIFQGLPFFIGLLINVNIPMPLAAAVGAITADAGKVA